MSKEEYSFQAQNVIQAEYLIVMKYTRRQLISNVGIIKNFTYYVYLYF